jgi:DNA-binding transcriptional regulator YiaG
MKTIPEQPSIVKPYFTGAMSREEFSSIQAALGLSNAGLARTLGVSKNSIEYWRAGTRPINGPVALCMRLLLERNGGGQ